jgi:Helix-turn-helix domain
MAGYEAPGAREGGTEPSEVRHLTQRQLAHRLGVSQRTLEGWRYRGKGPAYLRLEGRVAYRLTDVEHFEQECLQTTSLAGDP